jgi:hypothetical protein
MADNGGGGGMLVPMAVLFAGYTIGSYGWILLKGWNITFRSWISPLNPYRGFEKGTTPLCVPPGSVFPTGVGGVKCGKASGSGPGINQPIGSPVAPRRGPGGKKTCPPGYKLDSTGFCVSMLPPPGAK